MTLKARSSTGPAQGLKFHLEVHRIAAWFTNSANPRPALGQTYAVAEGALSFDGQSPLHK